MTDNTNPKPNYTVDELKAADLDIREDLFTWATMKPAMGEDFKIKDPLGKEMDYLEMGENLVARHRAISSLLTLHDADVLRAENDREHLSQHQEQGKPLATWELELMGLRKLSDIKYRVSCMTCADNTNPEEYWGKKLEWNDAQGNLVTEMHLDFAIQARDSHLDNFGDHKVELDLI